MEVCAKNDGSSSAVSSTDQPIVIVANDADEEGPRGIKRRLGLTGLCCSYERIKDFSISNITSIIDALVWTFEQLIEKV